MRKGKNVSKDELLTLKKCSHRVIIPLYIPKEEDYFEDAFKIFTYCLFSVRKTAFSPINISVISNGSCNSINQKLSNLQQEGHIDELIIENENIGKINSILKAVRTADERLITISDADVLFLNNWEKEVVSIFEAFPKAGVICPVPVFRTHDILTSNIWKRYLFSKKIRFLPVKNIEDLTRFANSIGWPWLNDEYKDVIGTISSKNGVIAVLGSSHFVATYKREVFSQLPKYNSEYKLGGDSENLYTDKPVLKMGGYRLSTYGNYAYHLGNTFEDWMELEFNSLMQEEKSYNDFNQLKTLKKSIFDYYFSEKIFSKLFRKSFLKKIILKKKGLTNDQIKNFLKNK